MDTMEVRRRSPQAAVQERKRADETLKPFLSALKHWNGKAAHLRGRVESAYSTEEDRCLARLECGVLLTEIRHRQRDLRSAIKGEPPHSRLDDVEAAFQRLIDLLHMMLEGVAN